MCTLGQKVAQGWNVCYDKKSYKNWQTQLQTRAFSTHLWNNFFWSFWHEQILRWYCLMRACLMTWVHSDLTSPFCNFIKLRKNSNFFFLPFNKMTCKGDIIRKCGIHIISGTRPSPLPSISWKSWHLCSQEKKHWIYVIPEILNSAANWFTLRIQVGDTLAVHVCA